LYQAFYNLKDQPFRLTPDPAFMYMTANHREALAGLVYSVCTRPGLMVLTGEAGTGKTTLIYSLLDLLEKRRFLTALCTNPVLTREELFDSLIQKFGVSCTSSLKSRQLSALQETLLRSRTDGRPCVLIVDEAQRLSLELLEEIRMLLNLETPREKLLQIIIAGQPELSDILRQPQLRQFKQRVSCQCKLTPLSLPEVKEYIDHRLAHAGMPRQTLFSGAVIERIHEYSGGIPRLVNCLCDASLQTGFAMRAPALTAAVVDEAAKDLDLIRQAVPAEPKSLDSMLPFLTSKPTNGHAASSGDSERNGNGSHAAESNVPPESYATRQKSVKFFAGLVDRWR
jgi:general secretion pathway protein A